MHPLPFLDDLWIFGDAPGFTLPGNGGSRRCFIWRTGLDIWSSFLELIYTKRIVINDWANYYYYLYIFSYISSVRNSFYSISRELYGGTNMHKYNSNLYSLSLSILHRNDWYDLTCLNYKTSTICQTLYEQIKLIIWIT